MNINNDRRSYSGRSVLIVCAMLLIHLGVNLIPGLIPNVTASEEIKLLITKGLHALSCLLPALIYRLLTGPIGIRRTLKVNCMPVLPMFFISLALISGALQLNIVLLEVIGRTSVRNTSFLAVNTYGGVGGIILSVFLFVLLPAICEELFFRYALLEGFGNGMYGIIISALCFSVMHYNLFATPYTFIAGIVFGCCAAATGSLMLSTLLHVTINGIALLLSYMKNMLGTQMYITFESILWSIIFAAGVIFAVFTLLNYSRQHNVLGTDMYEDVSDQPDRPSSFIVVLLPVLYIVAIIVWQLIKMIV